MRGRSWNHWLALLGLCVLLASSSAWADTYSHVEEFGDLTHFDALNSTALWDTSAGHITLPPYEISEAGSCATSGNCRSVTLHGDYAFVMSSGDGVDVVDISDVTSPSIVTTYDPGGYAYQGTVAGDHLYLADDTAGLAILDITDPTSPSTVAVYPTPGKVRGVAVAGDLAFVADNTGGFFSLDVTDPSAPVLQQAIVPAGQPQDVELAGDVAYVASWDAGVHAINVTDPTSMSVIGTYNTPGVAVAVSIQGDCLYVADAAGGLLVLDISDPTTLTLLSSTSTPDDAQTVAVAGDYAYVPCDGAGVLVYDVTDPSAPELLGVHDTPGHAFHAALAGEHAFVADRDGGLRILRVCDIDQISGDCQAMAVAGDYAYVGRSDWIAIVDVSDPASPVLADTFEVTHPGPTWRFAIHDICIDGDYMVVGGGPFEATDQSIEIFDISDPLHPASLALIDDLGFVSSVELDGDWLYVMTPYWCQVFDFSDPTTPALSGYLSGTGGYCHEIDGAVAYLPFEHFGQTEEVKLFDIGDPTSAPLIGTYDVEHGGGNYETVSNVLVDGDIMYLTTDRVERVDITDMSAPGFLDFTATSTAGHYKRASLEGDYLFLTSDGDQIFTFGAFEVHRVYQRAHDLDGTTILSLDVEPDGETVTMARLAAEYTGEIIWWLSADGGAHWLQVDPRGRWYDLPHPGHELL